MRVYLRLAVAVLLVASPAMSGTLDGIRVEHPRLFLSRSDWEDLKVRISNDAQSRQWFEFLQDKANKNLKDAPVERKLENNRLLNQSRLALKRITEWSALYRITGNRVYFERARKEMNAVAKFKDWHPSHFLDTAEMTAAMAIGLDWLYDTFEKRDRNLFIKAIQKLGLKPGLTIHEKQDECIGTGNWNQVCYGGLTLGALATAEADPALSEKILNLALDKTLSGLSTYSPDGAWPEGPSYWEYATRYTVFFISSLISSFGHDFHLLDTPGLSQTGTFRMHVTGPSGLHFNYGDAEAEFRPAPQMYWFAAAFNEPGYASHESYFIKNSPTIWHLLADHRSGLESGRADTPDGFPSGVPTDARFSRIQLATFRESWDPQAIYVAFKGGDKDAGHRHLDAGSFILDAFGERWALDLGRDSYRLPGYFGSKRWTYFRIKTESHNTLVVDGENQDKDENAPLVNFQTSRDGGFGIVDLTDVYPAKRVWRGIQLSRLRKQVLVQDEINLKKAKDVIWTMMTQAQVSLDGDRAVLSQNGKKLQVNLLEPDGAVFEVMSAAAPKPEKQQKNAKRLVIRMKNIKSTVVRVVFQEEGANAPLPEFKPLNQWDSGNF